MNKAQLTEMLQEFFAERPGETLSLKEIIPFPPSYDASSQDAGD